MIYLACDMNCNNSGNFFRVIGTFCDIVSDNISYQVGDTFYPKQHCYLCRPKGLEKFKYSEALDILIPMEYTRWVGNRF